MGFSSVLNFNRAHYPVTVLGPGRRLGIWLQGCSIRCQGCVSRDTWTPGPEFEMMVSEVLQACRGLCLEPPQGVTISGGEPFDQPEALQDLLAGLHAWRQELATPFDILCYSGFSQTTLSQTFPDILNMLDVLIAGPFMPEQDVPARWRGSRNQSVTLISPLGQKRWGEIDLDSPNIKALQVVVDESSIWCIGIPRVGDMEKLRIAAEEKGLTIEGVSW